jgi:hypothetical protein
VSRQSKLRNKRKFYVKRAFGSGGKADTKPTGNAGPARTTPKHGKAKRWPYNADARKKFVQKESR